MKLSAALIVRNEATEIEACLDTLAGFDEIVIVDTGSADDTVAKIAGWHTRYHGELRVDCRFLWCDDFSAARNYAAGLCSGDWIVHVDADMRLMPGGVGILRDYLRTIHDNPHARTLALTQESARGGWRNRRPLCHRPGVKWVGAIHEALERDDDLTAEAVVLHYGYSASHDHDPERNLRILRAEAERDPSPRTCYYLGAELFERGKIGEAVGWFEKCAATTAWRAERGDAWLYLAKIRWRQNRGDEAREAAARALINTPDCREVLELLAEMSWPAEAAHWRRYAASASNAGVIFARSCPLRESSAPGQD